MAIIIQFPTKKKVAVEPTRKPGTPLKLALPSEIELHWTETPFPEDAYEDEDGCLICAQDKRAALEELFACYGLCLHNNAQSAIEIWKLLAYRYGQAVRLADAQRAIEIESICPNLSTEERHYCIEVAAGNIQVAQRLATRIFKSSYRSFFCCSTGHS